jgi:predicted SAM-dependent methyltransferase
VGKWLIPRLPVNPLTFDVLRLELNAFRVRLAWKFLPHRWWRLRQIRRMRGIYVNVASAGFLLDGFVHLDLFGGAHNVIRWDCTHSLPFADNSCRGIRVEHFVEHIEPRHYLPQFLAHCHRTLEPGGVLRIIVPDAERYIRAYVRPGMEGFRELGFKEKLPDDLPTRMDVINHVFRQGHEHHWAYDFETLAHRLKAVGFGSVERAAFRQSLDPCLGQDRAVHAPYSLYVDAVKDPAAAKDPGEAGREVGSAAEGIHP